MRVLCLIQSILEGIQCTLSGCSEYGKSKQSDFDSKGSQIDLWSNLVESQKMLDCFILRKHSNLFMTYKVSIKIHTRETAALHTIRDLDYDLKMYQILIEAGILCAG